MSSVQSVESSSWDYVSLEAKYFELFDHLPSEAQSTVRALEALLDLKLAGLIEKWEDSQLATETLLTQEEE